MFNLLLKKYYNTSTESFKSIFDFGDLTKKQFNIKVGNSLKVQHIPVYDQTFLEWFVGFTEGDGSFIICNNKKRLIFTITQKDPSFLYKLRTTLGFGSILNDNKFKEIKRYSVSHRSQIRILIHIFNGNLLLNKTNKRFSKWVEEYNKTLKVGEDLIILKQSICDTFIKKNSLFNNAWFWGFIEAEGCFNISLRLKLNRVSFRFIIDQTAEYDFMLFVKKSFNNKGSLYKRKESISGVAWRYEISSSDILINYLNKYNFRTKKNITFCRWKSAINLNNLIKKDKKKNFENRQKRLLLLIENINTSI